MRFSEFKRLLNRKHSQMEQINLLIPLDELYVFKSANNKLIKLVEDGRSFERDGRWIIQPIAISESFVYIVCPFCHEIHLHGNDGGAYEGVRVTHCERHFCMESYEIIKPLGTKRKGVKRVAKHKQGRNGKTHR